MPDTDPPIRFQQSLKRTTIQKKSRLERRGAGHHRAASCRSCNSRPPKSFWSKTTVSEVQPQTLVPRVPPPFVARDGPLETPLPPPPPPVAKRECTGSGPGGRSCQCRRWVFNAEGGPRMQITTAPCFISDALRGGYRPFFSPRFGSGRVQGAPQVAGNDKMHQPVPQPHHYPKPQSFTEPGPGSGGPRGSYNGGCR